MHKNGRNTCQKKWFIHDTSIREALMAKYIKANIKALWLHEFEHHVYNLHAYCNKVYYYLIIMFKKSVHFACLHDNVS